MLCKIMNKTINVTTLCKSYMVKIRRAINKNGDKSVIREDVPSETFSPSKTSLSLKQCVNIIREQLHIEETGIGDVIKIALKEFNIPELTERCNKQRTPLHKTHIIITEGLGMSLSDELV